MSFKQTRFLAQGKVLNVTSDEFTFGHYFTQPVGEEPTSLISITASTTLTISASNSPRNLKFVTNGKLTFVETSGTAGGSDIVVEDLATGTSGDLITYDAAGVPTTLDVGTDLQVLTSHGPGLAPTFENGGRVLLTTVDASTDAFIALENYMDSSFDHYEIEIITALPSTTGGKLYATLGTGATPTYQTGASDYSWCTQEVFADSATIGAAIHSGSQDLNDSKINLTGLTNATNAAADGGVCMSIKIFKPSDASASTVMKFLGFAGNPTFDMDISGTARLRAASAVTSIKFEFHNGNTASGTYKIYGIAK